MNIKRMATFWNFWYGLWISFCTITVVPSPLPLVLPDVLFLRFPWRRRDGRRRMNWNPSKFIARITVWAVAPLRIILRCRKWRHRFVCEWFLRLYAHITQRDEFVFFPPTKSTSNRSARTDGNESVARGRYDDGAVMLRGRNSPLVIALCTAPHRTNTITLAATYTRLYYMFASSSFIHQDLNSKFQPTENAI